MQTRFIKNFCLYFLIPAVSYSAVICPLDATNTAVVIIDMQPGFVNRIGRVNEEPNKAKFEKLIEEQQALIAHAKFANLPIIFIQTIPGGPTFESLTDATKNYPQTSVLTKTADGMLDEKSLYRDQVWSHLEQNKIGRLIVSGINGDSCVKESMYGAMMGNCSVVAYSPGIADLNSSTIEYPFHYSQSFGPRCRSCSFKEAQSLDELSEIVRGPSSVKTGARKASMGKIAPKKKAFTTKAK